MSKQKILYYIETTVFDTMQQLSIFIYNITMNQKEFDFETYFETIYRSTIEDSLKFLNIKNIENYKNIFHKHLLFIYNMSIENATLFTVKDISNRKELFNYWKINKKIFISEIIEIYKTE